MKKIVPTKQAPPPAGPYSPVVGLGDLIFISGQGPMEMKTGKFVNATLAQEARLTLDNLKNILEDVGSSLQAVLKVTVYLDDMDNFAEFNQIYAEYFPKDPPARTCIQAARLPGGIKVEIDVIACCGFGKKESPG
jgi:2-iminobutanoate/2-iminopropanoate deaminase